MIALTGWRLYALSALGGVVGTGALVFAHFWHADLIADRRAQAAIDACERKHAEADRDGWKDYAETSQTVAAENAARWDAFNARLDSIETGMARIADKATLDNRAAEAAFRDYERQINDLREEIGAAGCSPDDQLRQRAEDALSRLQARLGGETDPR